MGTILWYNGDGMRRNTINVIPLWYESENMVRLVKGKQYADWHRPSIDKMFRRRDPRHWKAI
jgi:hypothetical protein